MTHFAASGMVPRVDTVSALREQIKAWRAEGLTVAFVPTMGALHAGHQSLIRLGASLADRVVTSIFVNPIQFGPKEDFAAYPRKPDADRTAIAEAGGHLAYMPEVEKMYPSDFSTAVEVAGISSGLCGDRRPGHFRGVATVVSKLLNQCQPDIAIFGEKDYQQLLVIRRMVRDLEMPIRIVGAPTIREADGLAMSSRNAYLTPEQREAAPSLHALMTVAARRIGAGETAARVLDDIAAQIVEAGFTSVDYLELRDAETLAPTERPQRPCRLLAAAFLGKTRLIDNIAVE